MAGGAVEEVEGVEADEAMGGENSDLVLVLKLILRSLYTKNHRPSAGKTIAARACA